MLDLGAFGAIEDEEREEWCPYKLCTAKEQCAKFRVLSLSSMCSMKEPDGCINADPKTMKMCRIGLKTINNGNVSKGPQFPRRLENLGCVRGVHLDG